MANTLKVGIIQQSNGNLKDDNINKCVVAIKACAANGAEIVVLQELHNHLYFCQSEDIQNFDLAEPIPGPSTNFFGALAKDLGIVIVCALFEKRATGIYHNTAIVLEKNGKIAGKYRKMHIPDDPAYYEKFYFSPGDLGFQPISTSVGKLGILLCWDQWYPEAARLMALAGAEILIYPTAIGFDLNDTIGEKTRQFDAWQTIQRGHAIANNLPLITVNRVGYEADPSKCTKGIDFWGGSFIADQQGALLFTASKDNEQSAVIGIDLNKTETTRRIWPFFRDRRIDAYAGLTKRWLD